MTQPVASEAAVITESVLHDTNMLSIFWDSGWVGRIVFLLLVGFSIASWVVIFAKAFLYTRAVRQSGQFLLHFRRSKRFSEVSGASNESLASPLVGLFQAAYAELDSQVKAHTREPGNANAPFRIKRLQGIERALLRSAGQETRILTRHLGILATTAAVTPFIGLFGTVMGIMGAFQDMAKSGSTSIIVVAPGIAEALINTAAGLGAAIPALIAYNLYQNRVRDFRGEMEDFAMEFLNLAERNFT